MMTRMRILWISLSLAANSAACAQSSINASTNSAVGSKGNTKAGAAQAAAQIAASEALATAAAAQTMAQQAQTTAGALDSMTVNSIDYPFVYDAVELPVSIHGEWVSSTATGTDNTSAMASIVAAASVGPIIPTGVAVEADIKNGFQKTIHFPSGARIKLRTFPPRMPDGVNLDAPNVTFFISDPAGHGPVWANTNPGNTFGTTHDTLRNFKVVYVGNRSSTGWGWGVVTGTSLTVDGVSCYGFSICGVVAGVEYSSIIRSNISHAKIGIAFLPGSNGSSTSPAVPAIDGHPSINNNTWGNTFRGNQINIVCNGCTTSTFGAGSASFGSVANIVFGAIDFPFLDTITMTGARSAVCTPSSTIALTIDHSSATLPAEGILVVGPDGHPLGAYQVNGGKGFTKDNPRVTVPAPSGSAPGCTLPPALTAHIFAMTGVLPFAGEANAGESQNIVHDQNMESEAVDALGIMGRPRMGFQIVAGPNAQLNTFDAIVNGLGTGAPQGFARHLRVEGGKNVVIRPLLSHMVDPVTGSTCPFIETQGLEIDATQESGPPEDLLCGPNAVPDYNSYSSPVRGWNGPLLSTRGLSAFGTTTGRAYQDTFLDVHIPGESSARVTGLIAGVVGYGDGAHPQDVTVGRVLGSALGGIWGPIAGAYSAAPTAVGLHGGVPQSIDRFISTNANSPAPPVGQPPSPGSSGIPKNAVCEATYNWNGRGSNWSTWAFGVIAHCNNGQNGGDLVYQSFNHPKGFELYSPAPIAALGIIAQQAIAPRAGSTCYQANQFIFSQDKHITYCSGNPGTWQTVF